MAKLNELEKSQIIKQLFNSKKDGTCGLYSIEALVPTPKLIAY